MREIVINSRRHGTRTVLVDDEDFELVRPYKWHIIKNNKRFYAVTTVRISPGVNGQRSLHMHRLITGKKFKAVDHIDLNGLNNQRQNLRDGSGSVNNVNREMKYNPNGYKGVTLLKNCKTNPYQARIVVDYKIIHLGMFPTAISAALAYDDAARKHRGSMAMTNF